LTLPRVLFVDDEPAVLDGLRDSLRRDRKRWDMVFARGAEQGLDEVRQARFQVVLSDMRMPGIDGAEFLSRVKAICPEAVRIVLSGQADTEATIRAVLVAQQFLSKPCELQVLRAAIGRACELQRLLCDETMRSVVGLMESLPSVPDAYLRLTRAAADPSKGAAELAREVECDPAMSVKVLQLVNSAFFGVARRVTSIHQAVAYLGVETLKRLALSAQVFSAIERQPVPGFSLEAVQASSLLGANMAKRFLLGSPRAEEAATAALIRDVGKIILAMAFRERYVDAERDVVATGRTAFALERERLGVSHPEVGAYLLGVWGLPLSILEAVCYHHQPSSAPEGPAEVLAAVHAADAFVGCDYADDSSKLPVDLAFLARAGVSIELGRWLRIATEEKERFASSTASA
jgi:HD-like signal output (HDOD) protein